MDDGCFDAVCKFIGSCLTCFETEVAKREADRTAAAAAKAAGAKTATGGKVYITVPTVELMSREVNRPDLQIMKCL